MKTTEQGLFVFAFSSLAEPVPSGPERSRARARRKRTLDGEDRWETLVEGGKGPTLAVREQVALKSGKR